MQGAHKPAHHMGRECFTVVTDACELHKLGWLVT